jgi:3-phosphoshikimate 1-carboxyvinyltransferase
VAPPEALLKPLQELPDLLQIPPLAGAAGVHGRFNTRLRVPGSKSLTNRALLLAALAEGESTIRNPLLGADDTERMMAALADLGVVAFQSGDTLQIGGCGGRWDIDAEATLDLGNAGTGVRFLSAAAMLSPVPLVIDGNARMRERPLGELAGALATLGACVEYLGRPGCPPVRITPPPMAEAPSAVRLGRTASSQFISALLLAAPFLPAGLTIQLEDEITSRSYVQMTLGLLDHLGASVRSSEDLRVMRVAGGGLKGFDYTVEPDASSATYFWAAAATNPGSACRVEGLDARSLQGDTGFVEVLSRMGATILRDDAERPAMGIRGPAALDPVMADMSDMPDAALSLAVACCFAGGRSVIRGLRTLRVKESDRIAALQAELSKLGVKVEVGVLGDPDTITITPPPAGVDCSKSAARVEFDTYDDHRMAMALALFGLKRPNVFVRNPACVAKTFPGYWQTLADLY